MSNKQKSIYTITIVARGTGRICLLETHSNKKLANERLERLNEIWFGRDRDGSDNRTMFHISLTDSKLRRKTRGMGQL